MKLNVLFPAVLFCCIVTVAYSQDTQEEEQVSLKELKDRSIDALDDIKTYRAEDVLDNIRKTMKQFNEASRRILEAAPGDEGGHVDGLIEFYEDASKNFRDIVTHKPEILQHVQARRKELDGIMREAREEIRALEGRVAEVDRQPRSTDEFQRNVEDQQRKTLKNLYTQQINSVQVWLGRYDNVVANAGSLTQAIDRLLYVIELTVPIYEQSAKALTMNRDLKNAMDLFESQEEIDGLTDELITSWIETEIMISDALESLGSTGALP